MITGQLLQTDIGRYEGHEHWVPVSEIPGVIMPERVPPPPPILSPQIVAPENVTPENMTPEKIVEDKRSGCMELTGCFFPILGLIFWAVFVNSQPNKAKHIGIYALIGLTVGILAWIFIVAVAYN